ncbi:MAG: hypothetical protein K0R25_1281 [Rickettsiaceae bacterium]|jgi:hypothetical protein|nr:hypothetical protein [Rickettsiaceae bacterium]
MTIDKEERITVIKRILIYLICFLCASLLFAETLSNVGGWAIILLIIYLVASFLFRQVSDPIIGKIVCTMFSLIMILNYFFGLTSIKFFGIEGIGLSISVVGYVFVLGTGFYIKSLWQRTIFRILWLIPLLLLLHILYLVALSIGPALGN